MLKRFNGHMAFKSKQNKGSVFMFTLPIEMTNDKLEHKDLHDTEQKIVRETQLEERLQFDKLKGGPLNTNMLSASD